MLDKFLSRVNTSSQDNKSVNQKIEDYNKKVIEDKKTIKPESNVDWNKVHIPERYIDNKFSGFQNISKPLSPKVNHIAKNPLKSFQRPSTYNIRPQRNYDNDFQHNQKQYSPRREFIDDGSYFCSYAVGGNTLVCYKNKEKVEFLLEGIYHPDKNNYLAKRANYFLNDLVKKQKVYVEPTENGTYNIFLDSEKNSCINTILINEGYHNSEPSNSQSKDKKTSFSKYKNTQKNEKDIDVKNEDNSEQIKQKKNYAYGLFATNHNTFEALFNKEKITLTIPGINNISNEHQKICKSIIYDFVSKKSIVLKFLNEENGIRYVEVYNKEGDCLNQLINNKNFPTFIEQNSHNNYEEKNEETTSNIIVDNERCSENDGNGVDSDNNGAEVDVPDVITLPSMFKQPISSKPDSPFKKKTFQPIEKITTNELSNNEVSMNVQESFNEEINVPDVITLPGMFKKPIASKPDSPFKKKTFQPIEKITTNELSINELSINAQEKFNEEINVPDIVTLPDMFKKPIASKPDSPFKKKMIELELENTQSSLKNIDNLQEENKIPIKKKLSFIKR